MVNPLKGPIHRARAPMGINGKQFREQREIRATSIRRNFWLPDEQSRFREHARAFK